MATTGIDGESWEPAGLAGELRGAHLVRIVSRADGDGLAAAAILGRALGELGIPRHLSLSPAAAGAAPRLEEAGTPVTLGFPDLNRTCRSASAARCAYDVARELGIEPDPGLALAGSVAAGVEPQGRPLEAGRERGMSTRPGLAIPTGDLATGLAHTGYLHASFSGDVAAARDFLAELGLPEEPGADARERLASAVALDATDAPTSRAATAIERALAPRTSPTAFETIGGYADVLTAAAALEPGRALAALLGSADRETLLDLWTEYGAALHEGVEAVTADGAVATGRVEAIPPREVARLARDFAVAADRVYVVGPDSLALATAGAEARSVLETRFESEAVIGTETLATARIDTDIESVRETIEGQQ
ncbi:MAG: hypothetical protein ABEJ60_02095 [Halodesulfurarchaeum sp.]